MLFALASTAAALVAMISRSISPRSAGFVDARISECKLDLPLTRKPSSFNALACSSRRVNTVVSIIGPRWPANRLPIVPAPTMQTRSSFIPIQQDL